MKHHDFNIEFVTNQIQNKNAGSKEYRYEAMITTLSKSFQLFKVSNIRRSSNDGTVTLSSSYYLTSYPILKDTDNRWIDPVTLQTNNFLKVIGNVIDQYFTAGNAYRLN